MQTIRSIKALFNGTPTIEGAGVKLRRYFSRDEVELFDPFLLLDDFSGRKESDYIKGFPWHPHRGIETITYVLNGSVEHGDSLGNKGTITNGDLQWMTAGSGIIHQEMPRGDPGGMLSGIQLWANLPAKKKMVDPHYCDLHEKDIPIVHGPDGSLYRIIAGEMEGVVGPVRDIAVHPSYFDIIMPARSEFAYTTPSKHTFFVYVLDGEAHFGEMENYGRNSNARFATVDEDQRPSVKSGTVALFTSGNVLSIATGDRPVRFLLVGGNPLHEQIAWYGPIVMNTDEELKSAFEEFQIGTFIKHHKK